MKKEIRNILNELVNNRITKSTITSLVTNKLIDYKPIRVIINDVKPSNLVKEEDYRFDFTLIFDEDTFDGSIWYVNTRNKANIIITEIGLD